MSAGRRAPGLQLPPGVDVRVEVRPPWAFRLPLRGGMDGVLRRDGVRLLRLLHVEGVPAVVGVVQPSADRVLFGARAESVRVAKEAIARMRFALGVDDDLSSFHERFRFDPLIGRAVRRDPTLRVRRRPEPFEALAWAVTEQLIEFSRAVEIQRRIVRRLGRRCAVSGLRDVPDAAAVAGCAPAMLQSFDLSAGRSLALVTAARAVASGRVVLRGNASEVERGWARLRTIPGIGAWTVEMLALGGQGRYDQVPAGDLGFLVVVGRLLRGGRGGGGGGVRASEEDVRMLLERFGEWRGLAGTYLLQGGGPTALAA